MTRRSSFTERLPASQISLSTRVGHYGGAHTVGRILHSFSTSPTALICRICNRSTSKSISTAKTRIMGQDRISLTCSMVRFSMRTTLEGRPFAALLPEPQHYRPISQRRRATTQTESDCRRCCANGDHLSRTRFQLSTSSGALKLRSQMSYPSKSELSPINFVSAAKFCNDPVTSRVARTFHRTSSLARQYFRNDQTGPDPGLPPCRLSAMVWSFAF
jgi:hypothetical protein